MTLLETQHAWPAAADEPRRPPIRLVAIDVDGTLLTSRKELKSATIRAILDCAWAGVKVVLASARSPRTARNIHEALKLDTLSIHYNGALVTDPSTRRNIVHQSLGHGLVRRIIKAARRVDPGCIVNAEILDKWYTDTIDDPAGLTRASGWRFEPDFVGPLDAFLTVPVTKLTLLTPRRTYESVRDAIAYRFGSEVAIGVSEGHMIQVLKAGVDKSVALRHVARHYGVDRSEVMAIGDAPNDAAMLRWAGLGVAVGNAHPHARAAAKVVVPANDENGVAHALRRFVLDV